MLPLKRLLLGALTLAISGVGLAEEVSAVIRPLPREPIFEGDRLALQARLRRLTVPVSRARPLPVGFTLPGYRASEGRGWLLEQRVITAYVLVAQWPEGEADRLLIGTEETTVGLGEPHLGLAVLGGGGGVQEPAQVSAGELFPGARVFAVDERGQLVTLVIKAPGDEPLNYYWRALGATLLPGTPVADGAGDIISMVGLSASERGESLLLPPKALRALMARAPEWSLP